MPIPHVRIDVYADETCAERIWAGRTDGEGFLAFTAVPSHSYVAVTEQMKDGFVPRDIYLLEGTHTELTVELEFPESSFGTLKLGDVIRNFTLKDASGNDCTVSELLQTKKAIVLNFWFEGCGPCRAEFPFLQAAYEAYSEDVAVIAINPYDGTAQSVAAYAQELGLTFPVMKGTPTWSGCMGLTAYPTTVVIDRYGMICMVHKNSVTETGVFEKIFAHFAADDYTQNTFRNLSDLP